MPLMNVDLQFTPQSGHVSILKLQVRTQLTPNFIKNKNKKLIG